jgi:O-antigen ligase
MAAAIQRQHWPALALFALAACGTGALAGIAPPLAIGAGLGLMFMLVALANLYAGLIIFILLTFVADLPSYGGAAVSASKAAGLVLLISWLATLAMRRDAKADFLSVHPVATWTLILFIAWAAMSQSWAEDPAASRDALFRLALNAVFFLIVYSAVRTRGQAIGAASAFVAGACLDAAFGLLNPVSVANTARLAGSISKPGELAAALVAGLVLSLGLVAALKRMPAARLAALAAAPLCALGVFFTGSRGGLVALAVALATFIAVGSKWRGRVLALTVVIVVAGVGFYTYAASADLRAHTSSIDTGSGRIDLWTVAWRMVEQSPLQGVGIGNFPISSVHYVLTPGTVAHAQFVIDTPKVAHNTYLEFWAETGLVGLALFLVLAAFCVRSSLKAAREFTKAGDIPLEMLARALLVAQAAFLAGAFFTSREYAKDVWLILALGPTFLAVARAQEDASESAERPTVASSTGEVATRAHA